LIGGVSASLVIFLGAKGGFAIFSNNEIDLNPYTLLFLCLIGSVYSEAVWARAYKYISADNQEVNESTNQNGDVETNTESKNTTEEPSSDNKDDQP